MTSLIARRGSLGIVHDGELLNSTFGSATVVGPQFICIGKFVLGDVNQDGVLNLLDVRPFVDLVSNGLYLIHADTNEDGEVNLLDVAAFVDLLNN